MFIVEHRRHTMRTKPGQHLSQAGVDLARAVGSTMGRFDLVVTSTIPRAFETAIAMGYAVGEQIEALADFSAFTDLTVLETFQRVRDAMSSETEGTLARFGNAVVALHERIVERLPPNGSALLVSHGGFPEATAVACVPSVDYESWGPGCDYCEGVRLRHDGRSWIGAELLRLPSS